MSSSSSSYTSAFAGGTVIALSALVFLVLANKRTGISGIFGTGLLGLLRGQALDPVSSTFLSSFLVASVYAPKGIISSASASEKINLTAPAYILSGLLVGFGVRLGNGCTSGHGVCGLSRLSKRGAVAVGTFMAVGIAVASFLGSEGIFRESASSSSSFTSFPFSSKNMPEQETWTRSIVLLAAFLLLWQAPTKLSTTPLIHFAALVSGALFALGLTWSGMTQQEKVLNFLWPRFPGWDPSLMVVLGAAVGLLTPATLYVLNRQPGGKGALAMSKEETVDWRLVVGEAIFGLGWGITGLCPGPALVQFARGSNAKVALCFMPLYVVGYLLVDVLDKVLAVVGGGGKKMTKTK
jgi:uncharacterized membrane protein YedE/YeeE